MTLSLPASCIRGPEIAEPETLSDEIRAVDPAALAAYQHGIELLLAARSMLDAQARLAELRQMRAFLLGQLKTFEQQHPTAFAAALTEYDDQKTHPCTPQHDNTEDDSFGTAGR